MAPKKKTLSPRSPAHVGDCEVTIECNSFTCESVTNGLQINVSRKARINIAVKRDGNRDPSKSNGVGLSEFGGKGKGQRDIAPWDEYCFALVNPKDANSNSTSLIQKVLRLYKKELPDMRFAANTGKESMFLEKCISNGKYRTMILKTKSIDGLEEVLAAITYQIVPADTQYAEIPIAAVSSTYQQKGIGRLLFLELRHRLQSVGVCTILCWGDRNSEGFWSKQGFVSIAEIDKKGRARRVPIRADIRRALCYPGGSTLMVSHLNRSVSADPSDSPCSYMNQCKVFSSYASIKTQGFRHRGVNVSGLDMTAQAQDSLPDTSVAGGSQTEENRIGDSSRSHGGGEDAVHAMEVDRNIIGSGGSFVDVANTDWNQCQCSGVSKKRRIWEATLSSLKSKKVKGAHSTDCQIRSDRSLTTENMGKECCMAECSLGIPRDHQLAETIFENPLTSTDAEKSLRNYVTLTRPSEALHTNELQSKGGCFKIMLMNIADDSKKTHLTKVIDDLGGVVVSDGSESTHIVTGEVRRTLNFCVGLCSGAWVVSPAWLKESCREGRFVDEVPYVLDDRDYALKYGCDLKGAVLRARARPRALLEGYCVCISLHVQPPLKTLTAIISAAGGNAVRGLDRLKDPSKMIFIACEEDVEEALVAVKKGVWTFGSEWFMSCVMGQELDLEAPQFAESL